MYNNVWIITTLYTIVYKNHTKVTLVQKCTRILHHILDQFVSRFSRLYFSHILALCFFLCFSIFISISLTFFLQVLVKTFRKRGEMLALAMRALSLVSRRSWDPWLPVITLRRHSVSLSLLSSLPPPAHLFSAVDFLARRHRRSLFPSFAFCYRTISTEQTFDSRTSVLSASLSLFLSLTSVSLSLSLFPSSSRFTSHLRHCWPTTGTHRKTAIPRLVGFPPDRNPVNHQFTSRE